MKENKYDEAIFFEKYSQFPRSADGLRAAGEWHEFQKMLPGFTGKNVLDLGCGFGWHCIYAAEHGAKYVLGTDISEKMLAVAKAKNAHPNIEYQRTAIEDIVFAPGSFDIILSSLALHYVEDFASLCLKLHDCLTPGGSFVFSAEHPVFTAYGTQDWYYDEQGMKRHWPVDRYFTEGWRNTNFLGEQVLKHHKTLTTYMNGLLSADFSISRIVEPTPDRSLIDTVPEMQDELRRPMMLLVSAQK